MPVRTLAAGSGPARGVIEPGLAFSTGGKLQYRRFVTTCRPLTRSVPVTLRFCTVGASNLASDILWLFFSKTGFFSFGGFGVFLRALCLRK